MTLYLPIANAEQIIKPNFDLPRLILNAKNEKKVLPRTFREMNGKENAINIDNLHASASAQFSYQSLLALKERYKHRNLIIIDLRQESHFFINGNAVSLYKTLNTANVNKTISTIMKEEKELVSSMRKIPYAEIYERVGEKKRNNWTITKMPVFSVHTEKQLAESLSLGYFRFNVTDHRHPSDEEVDRFLEFVKTLPKNYWLHFHCAGGKGRSTSFLAMLDMIHNGNKLTFDEILTRQYELKGADLRKASVMVRKIDYVDSLIDRNEFLEKFYNFVITSYLPSNQTAKWSEWVK
jgi:protein-tyrosine phosphatase